MKMPLMLKPTILRSWPKKSWEINYLMEYHNPVLLKESVDGLNIKPDGVYVDVTFGGGGHSREILSRLGEKGKLYAFDQDEDALENALDDPRFTFCLLYTSDAVDDLLCVD